MQTDRFDLVIRQARIFDGTGGSPFVADLAIAGDRIARVGASLESGGVEIDAHGLALAPGFIDVHSHDDAAVFIAPGMEFKTMQGVTTDIVGNCGLGAAPFAAARRLFLDFNPKTKIPAWEDYAGYFKALEQEPPSLNVAVLAGHGTIRAAAMGNERRAPDTGEMAEMRAALREALTAGVVGMSTGLIYEPGRYAATEEIIELAREMKGTRAIYTSHMRNEASGLLDSIRETMRIGTEAGVPVQVSHHKASGRENWGKVRESLRLIDEARAGGLDATADQYPYTSGSTVLAAVLQNNALNERGRSGGIGTLEPEKILLASTPRHPEYEGRTIAQMTELFGLSAEAAAQRIVDEEGAGAFVVLESMDENDVRTVMRHPTTMIGSDGIMAGSKPHPRLYGTFPRVIGHYARDLGLMSIEEAIHRMTGMPARKFGLADRGVVRAGAFADLVIFDLAEFADVGTYADPCRYPQGVRYVFVNGRAVVSEGRHTGVRPGRALRRQD
ncbi:MAG TPA: D-aminoacylase [Candidatus Binataceae bacterium]|nr:D-aminoacylase [Candidatus Binataceae bacterium]